ncbi:MAG: hypothetical protein R2822_08910 [Spirosomataceae bacterium]
MDAAEYKHVAPGLIFLKYILMPSTNCTKNSRRVEGEYEGAGPRRPQRYLAEKIFYVPLRRALGLSRSRGYLPLVRILTMPWMPSKKTTPLRGRDCPRCLPKKNSTKAHSVK